MAEMDVVNVNETVETEEVCNDEVAVAADSSSKVDLGGYALLGLAGVGAFAIGKKVWTFGKKKYGELKVKLEEKKANKKASGDKPAENGESVQATNPEPEKPTES